MLIVRNQKCRKEIEFFKSLHDDFCFRDSQYDLQNHTHINYK